jgi:hypothetical protein
VAEIQKSKEPEIAPRLVTGDGQTKPVGSTMTRDELLAGITLLVQAIQGQRSQDAALSESLSQTIADTFERMEGKFRDRDGEWNIANYPERSVFNPKGEHRTLGQPRPLLNGEVFWVGTPMDEREMTRDEIEAANAIRPGIYHGGQWKVINLAPGQGKRALLVVFPNVEPDQRSSLPSMLTMLREMTGEPVASVA